MKAVVVTGGSFPRYARVRDLLGEADLVIAADSGLDSLEDLGIQPNLVVGDFDSLQNIHALDGMSEHAVVRYPHDKDETDTEIAFRHATAAGASEVGIIGGGGGRFSHYLGVLSLFHRESSPSWWLTDVTEYRLISDELKFEGEIGETISFFPVGGERCTMVSSGLKWELTGLVWHIGDIGVSNELSERLVRVEMKTGRLLMVRDMSG